MNSILHTLAWILVFYVPSAVVLLWLTWIKREHERRARQPFTEQPIRLAGESTRDQADRLFESAAEDLLAILLIGPFVGVVCMLMPSPQQLRIAAVCFSGISIASLIFGYRLRKKLLQSWDYRLGAKGEQVVGRELDRLIAQGYQVFHDLPFDGWNIDHVVVGPRGVFAVETKAWRKPPKGSSLKAEIILDGETLIRPGNRLDREALEQATRNAQTLTKWIADSAAELVPVVPVVALPGWSLSIKRYGTVAVYSATNMSEILPKRGKTPLNEGQIQRISFQLGKLCTVESAKAETGTPGRS